MRPSSLSGDTVFETALGERAVVVVAEQQVVGGVAGDVDIGPAIAVEISSDRGEAIARLHRGDAGFFADIGEGAVAVVVIEKAGFLRKPVGPQCTGMPL